MSLLARIQRGRTQMPPRLLVYGQEGIGKTTFGASAPNSVIVPTEDGLGQIVCARFPLVSTLDDVVGALTELHTEPHDYETVVIDSLDALERLIWDRICQDSHVTSIERADGGYGKGYTAALTYWRQVLVQLDMLRNQRGMVVVLIAHSKVERYEDPESAPYDRYAPRLHKHAAALVCEWADAVFFATWKIRTQTEDAGFGRRRTTAHAVGKEGGDRILRTVGGPACIAKNRYGIAEDLPLSWAAFEAALSPQPPEKGTQHNG
jgi:hypothetical protein